MAVGTVTAIFQLAGLALQTARLIQNLTDAPENARLLIHKTGHLHTLAKNVATVLENREAARGTSTPSMAEVAILESLGNSIVECEKYLLLIGRKLNRFRNARRNKTPQRVLDSVRFMFSEDSIKAQEKVVEVHLQIFSVSLNLLNQLDQHESYVQQVVGLDQSLRNRAADRRVSFENHRMINGLEQESPEEKNRFDSGEHLNEQTQEDEPNDDSDHELDLSHGCPRCRDAQFTVPDTPLAIAVKRDEAERVEGLIEAGADVLFKDVDRWTLLHHAVDRFKYKALTILLKSQYGQESQFVDAQTTQGYTALMLVARKAEKDGSLRLAEALLEHQCDVNLLDAEETQRTALYFTVDAPYSQNRDKFVDLLVKSGANLGSVYDKIPERFNQYSALRNYASVSINRSGSRGASIVQRFRSRGESQADSIEFEE